MNMQMKQDHLNLICDHIKNKLEDFKKTYAAEVVKSGSQEQVETCKASLQENLRPYEQQIMHIVYTMFKLNEESQDQATEADDTSFTDDLIDYDAITES